MSGQYDYIIFDGGVNDKSQSLNVGEISNSYEIDYDTSTTLGALESICKYLVLNFPESKKLFVIPHNIVTSSNNVNIGLRELFQKIVEVLKKWGIPSKTAYEKFYIPSIEAKIKNL